MGEGVNGNNNKLISLNLDGLINVIFLDCCKNHLLSLNVDSLRNLKHLACSKNKLKTLNVNDLKNLNFLDCYSNDLRSLFMKNGNDEMAYFIFFNYQLKYICCNESLIQQIKIDALNYGYLNCEVNSYCTFTPGGKFYQSKVITPMTLTKMDVMIKILDGPTQNSILPMEAIHGLSLQTPQETTPFQSKKARTPSHQ